MRGTGGGNKRYWLRETGTGSNVEVLAENERYWRGNKRYWLRETGTGSKVEVLVEIERCWR